MAYSSRIGQCQSFNALTNFATPYVKSSCFQPSFNTPQNDNNSDEPRTFYNSYRNITNNDSSCGYDAAHVGGPINPDKFSFFDARNALWRRENSVIVAKAPRDYSTPSGQKCPQQPYIVVDETNQQKVVCPILTSWDSQPQCATCMNVVFACERFREIDPVAYEKCREYQRMIHYNIVTPNGQLIPMAWEMTDDGFNTFATASKKCEFICGSCKTNYPSLNYGSLKCGGPTYAP
jgi:hypothetical protein